ncbi:MAG TPA: DEAD/DEAH box helicase [Thermotogota bacterium]|nr:DEAD/DEAH box helicase [Thermotogota bacterium]
MTCLTKSELLKTDMYQHQIDAVEKMRRIRVGALYMEMGTGKTRAALELAARRIETGKVKKVLWLCPCSVKATIKRELDKHATQELKSKIDIYGIESLSGSTKLYLKLMNTAMKTPTFLIVDESNLVKNPRARRSVRIQSLSEITKYKLILNGTPISKNMADLYSQWRILDWRILGFKSYYTFASRHIKYDEKIRGRIKEITNSEEILNKIAPYTFQVRKDECIDLPPKTYSEQSFNMTTQQRYHYEKVKREYLSEIDELRPSTIYRLFTAVQHVVCGRRVTSMEIERMRTDPFFDDPHDNPRSQLLLDLISQTEGKVIIWCRYTHEIDTITELLTEEYGEGSTVKFFGALKLKEREASIESFSRDARFFVANKTCAGYGLNLQFCNYMIYYSNDWDWATRTQSEDRVHRIGQTENVHIVDISASSTIDNRILSCLRKKENMVESFKSRLEDKKFDIGKWLDGIAVRGEGGRKDAEKVFKQKRI